MPKDNDNPLDYVQIDPVTQCWLWKGNLRPGAYANVFWRGKGWGAHRLSWHLNRGPIPRGLQVLHKCDVPRCINPDHLFLGTHRDNMRDLATKRIYRRGLTGPGMQSIHQFLVKENMSQSEFAKAVKMTQPHLSRILAGDRNPSIRLLLRMASFTRIKVGKLVKELKPDARTL